MRLGTEMLAADKDFIVCDFRSVNSGREQACLEAIIRKVWTANPAARIISPIFPECENPAVDVVADRTALELLDETMAAYYGVHLVDYRQEVIDRLGDGEHLNVYMADAVHPTTTGHALASTMEQAAITANGWLNVEDHSTLPARLYDDGYYENTAPQRILGNANDGTTGTWNTTGTRIESSEAGATVTFVCTCKSFGLYSAGTANTVADVSIDGGDFMENRTVSHNGYDQDMSEGEHTIVIRVRSGVAIRIDEFWAI